MDPETRRLQATYLNDLVAFIETAVHSIADASDDAPKRRIMEIDSDF